MIMNLCGVRCAGVMIGTKEDFIKDLNKLVEKYQVYMRGYDADIMVESLSNGEHEFSVYFNGRNGEYQEWTLDD